MWWGSAREAVILGTLCTLGMLAFGFPYATMIGALVGATALIPIAGAYIGAGVGAILILTVSPVEALLFLVFIIILQQLEGNIVYPRVVGTKLGLPALWVLAAITVGGNVMGIGGMLLAVPLTTTLYRLVRENVAKREAAKGSSAPGNAGEAQAGNATPVAEAAAAGAPLRRGRRRQRKKHPSQRRSVEGSPPRRAGVAQEEVMDGCARGLAAKTRPPLGALPCVGQQHRLPEAVDLDPGQKAWKHQGADKAHKRKKPP